MDTFFFFIFSILDALAILILGFKIYRFPLKDYIWELFVFTVIIAFVSYYNRLVLEFPVIDPVVQLLLYIAFFRLILKTRMLYSLLISITGYLAFIVIQLILIFTLNILSIFPLDAIENQTGLDVNMLQVLTELLSFTIAFMLYKLNGGFSFIIRPPHTFIREKITKTKLKIYLVIIFSLGIFIFITYWHLQIEAKLMLVILFALIGFLALILIAYKRDGVTWSNDFRKK